MTQGQKLRQNRLQFCHTFRSTLHPAFRLILFLALLSLLYHRLRGLWLAQYRLKIHARKTTLLSCYFARAEIVPLIDLFP